MSTCRSAKVHRGGTALVLTGLLIGACSSGGSDSAPATVSIDETEGAATTIASSSSVVVDTDAETSATTPPPDEGSVSSAPESEPTEDAEGSEDAEGADATASTVDDVCETLGTDGFESRVDAFSRFVAAEDDGRSSIEAACGEDLVRLDDARAIRSAANALDERDDPIEITGLRCSSGDYSFIAENTSDVPVGVHVAFRVFADDDEEPTSSANYPIVIWSLEPGGQQGITGDFDEPDTDSYRCNLNARVFLSDTSPAGAGIPDVTNDARTGDDPTQWIGALLEAETLAVGSGDIDAAADTEDLRSVFYDDVFDATQASEPASRVPTAIRICSATVDQPDPDRMSLVYFITYSDGESFFRHGLFRRGADGQWRWLSAAHYFQSDDFADCAV